MVFSWHELYLDQNLIGIKYNHLIFNRFLLKSIFSQQQFE